ncbi:putative 7-carboxy-7-deazaguanine synthase QueE [Ruminococcus sp.]|uniref:putative 7-carboxy-7-deazaguanine synthase QueE n=1 Tax=Ruminococcus sp. TaxID=41978 RepID=UPI002E77A53D|nr:putative 7-carboxy-7-deazaguanine synthase QueE [Ruminococcus sp.]MEE1261937.1 putative 7-carboxy-7-deazaguanine synthase QueE [Ruminococcus sp.]
MLEVVEKFVSINGEGAHAGELAAFIRFKGCNLNCSYCDTSWANQPGAVFNAASVEELSEWVRVVNVNNVTLTGGEPLLQPEIGALVEALKDYRVEIETNGSVSLAGLAESGCRPVFTMDYKLPSSGMEAHMNSANFELLNRHDSVKFVVGSEADLIRAAEIIEEFSLIGKCHVYFSSVFGKIEPARIVEFMTENNLNGTRIQLQLHKFIWEPDKRGV